MLIKVNNDFISSRDQISVEKRVNLFERVDEILGDFSYSFTIPATSENLSILNLWSIDQSDKTIYGNIPCALLTDEGQELYRGTLRVENKNKREIECSFFSGNNNWLRLLTGKVNDIDLSAHDTVVDASTDISATFSNTDGIFFPVIDRGVMSTRSYINWKLDDFHGFLYVKTIINRIFLEAGLKLHGDILNDFRYNHLITSNNSQSIPQEEIDNRKAYVGKTNSQTFTTPAALLTFHLESDPYYPGDLWNTGTDRFTADIKMDVDVVLDITISATAPELPEVQIKVSGVTGNRAYFVGNGRVITIEGLELEATDYIEVFVSTYTGSIDVTAATLKVTPTKLYKVFSRSLLPDMTTRDFVTQVFSMFNPVVTYDTFSKTVYVNFFKNVKNNPELDISQYIDPSTIEEDYSEIINGYGQSNVFSYSESAAANIVAYNKSNTNAYGSGVVEPGNIHVQRDVDVITLDFVAVGESDTNPLGAFLPRLDYVTLEETELAATTKAVTASGTAAMVTASGFAEGDIIKITNSTVAGYEGTWICNSATGTTFTCFGLEYSANATVDVVKMEHVPVNDTDQVFLLAVPTINVSDFGNSTSIYIEQTSISSVATAYFYKPEQSLTIDNLRQSISFGDITITDAFQSTMLDDYWKDFDRILRDPVKIKCRACLPISVFHAMDFNTPLRVKAAGFNSLFYLNSIFGYMNSYTPCEVELIKL